MPKVLEYSAMQKEIAKLQSKADKLRNKDVGAVINSIVRSMHAYNLTVEEIDEAMNSKAPVKRRGRQPGSKNKPKQAGEQPAQ